jgi:hypothetical protein
MPRDIAASLFKLLDKTTSMCLGLTCRDLYALHLRRYKYPIPLISSRLEGAKEPHLHELLMSWMGPHYRYCHSIARFVKREIYGEEGSEEENDLVAREWDYVLSDCRLPSPFNLGDEWYSLAKAFIQDDFESSDDKEEWWIFWSRLCIFHQVTSLPA